ncbi:MAG: AEC family transporter [Candidatus Protistobacter heckmanni]|nr:AEC family transporter [Candidatus Protistobacter heckmanni]
MQLLGNATVPLMLFALGARMVGESIRSWRVGLLGAVLCPVTGLLSALIVAPLFTLTPLQHGLLFIFASLPPAVLNFLLTDRYQQEPERIATIVLLRNMLAVVFVPIGLYISLR